MKILHISKYYYPYIGGVENICKYLVEGMSQYESSVLCFNDSRKDVVELVNGHHIYRVGSWITIARQALSPRYYFIMKKAIKIEQPNIIHFHWANPFPAALLLLLIPKQTKLIIHWHMDIMKQSFIYKLIKPIETALLKRSNLILVTSPIYKQYSKPLYNFQKKTEILSCAIEEMLFQKSQGDEPEINNIKESYNNKPIVFFIGRHIQYKGLPYLIEAAKYIKSDCAIVIAGNGPLTEKLKSLNKCDNVHFIGRISDTELRRYLYASKVFAFPSVSKNEAFGLALAEAMYVGLPAVTFTVEGSGVNWVSINNQTCLQVENRNAVKYAEAIDILLNNNELWNRLSIAGKKRAQENFLLNQMIYKCNDYYKKII